MPCSPGMRACRALCVHREMVQAYRLERGRQEVEREEATGGYATEIAEYPPLITFKDWLVGTGRGSADFGVD